jgi:hypothetical protein
MDASVFGVINNIIDIFGRKENEGLYITEQYAKKAVTLFMGRQKGYPNEPGQYWVNRTTRAGRSVFADIIYEPGIMGWYLAHTMPYGVYLELANNRKHAALEPIVRELAPAYLKEMRELYGMG